MLKKVIKDSTPTMISVLLYSLYGVMDGLFVGKATGDIGLAAVNIGWPLVSLIMAMGVGIGSGGSVLISYYSGSGRSKEAREVYGSTIALLLVTGMLLLLLLLQYEKILYILGARNEVYIQAEAYIRILLFGSIPIVLGSGMLPVLRNIGMAFHALVCMVTGVILNIGINYYLMMILDWGVEGAAYGTVISQSIVVIMVAVFIGCNKKQELYVYLSPQYIREIIQSGITPFGIYIAPSITLIFTNLQCLAYGGETVVASYAVISYIVFPVLSTLGGVGDGTQPLISYYFGANKQGEVKEIRRIASCTLIILSVGIIIAVVTMTENIGMWFGLSEQARTYFTVGMRVSAIAFIGQAFTKFNGVYLNATMRSKFAVTLTYLESLLVNPILLLVLPMFGGVVGIWLAPSVTAMIMLLIYRKYQYVSQKEHREAL